MNELKQKYQFDFSSPIASPYEDAEIKNHSFKAVRRKDDLTCHLVVYKSKKAGQINSYHKKINKCMEITSLYLVPILECIKDEENSQLFIVLQWNQSFNLKECLKQETFGENIAILLVKDLLKGLKQLHKAGILHSFINIQNIELFKGKARLSYRYLIYKTYYLAPEVKQNHQKTASTDLFSLGVCLYRLIFGTLPFKQKTEEEYTKSVKKGISKKVSIPKCNFPIFISEQAQEIINSLCHYEANERQRSHKLLQSYQPSVKAETSELIEAALGQHYMLIKIEETKEQITKLLVMSPKYKRIYSMQIIDHNLTELSSYIQEVIAPFKNQANLHFANIKEFFPVPKNSIAIVYNYCAQGSLKSYRKNCPFDKTMLQEVQSLTNIVLTRWAGQYRFLDYEQVLIRQGKPVLKFPPYPTKQLKSKLKQSTKGSYFYAPQLESGVQSQSADSWSVGVLEYWMRFDCFPSFDKEDNLIIKDKSKLSPDQIRNLEELIVVKAKDRKNLFPIEGKPQLDPSRKISNDSSNSGGESARKSLKLKSSTRPKNNTLEVKNLPELEDHQEQSQDFQLLEIDPKMYKNRQSSSDVKDLNVFDRQQGQSFQQQAHQNQKDLESSKKQKRPNRRNQKYPPTPTAKTDDNKDTLGTPHLKTSTLSESQTGENKKLLNRFGSLSGQTQLKYNRDSNQLKHRNSLSKISQKSKDDKKSLNKSPSALEQPKEEKMFDKLKEQSWRLSQVQAHWTKPIRVIVKCVVEILLYLLIFYLSFFSTNGSLMSNRYNYTTQQLYLNVDQTSTTPTINFTLVTRNTSAAYSQLNNKTLDYVVNTAQCITNKYWTDSIILDLIQGSSFASYAVTGIMMVIVNLIVVALVLAKLDFPKAISYCEMDDNNYVGLYSWLIANLALSTLTSMTFILYGGLFKLQLDPCLSWTNFPSLQLLFRKDSSTFALKFGWLYAAVVLAWIVVIYVAVRPKNKLHKYVYGVLILAYLATIGGRSLGKYDGTVQSVVGACGELLITLVGAILFIFDMIVSCCLRKLPKNNKSATTINQQLDLNVTEVDLRVKK